MGKQHAFGSKLSLSLAVAVSAVLTACGGGGGGSSRGILSGLLVGLGLLSSGTVSIGRHGDDEGDVDVEEQKRAVA